MYRPTAGLNEYTPAIELSDNHVSDCLNLDPYRDRALQFNTVGITKMFDDNDGVIRAVVPAYKDVQYSQSEDEEEVECYVLAFNNNWKIYKIEDDGNAETVDDFTVSTVNTAEDCDVSTCIFNTEAERYYCFIISNDMRLHFVKENTQEYGYVDLPFMPNKMVVHANRIFIVSNNKLWWCRAGDLFSWYSEDYKEGYISSAQSLKNGSLAIDNQPDVGRLITFTHKKKGDTDTLGTIALSGEHLGVAQSETIALVSSGMVVSSKRYDEITSVVVSGWAAVGEADEVIIGVGPVGSKYVQGDSGYWTIEREQVINDICVLRENIYLFGPHNIHVFQGYSYDTFSLQQLISDIGLTPPYSEEDYAGDQVGYGYSSIAISNDTAYFRYNNNIYMFDGHSKPMIISRPVIQNGGSVNAVFGGINLEGNSWSLAAMDKYLFVYKTNSEPHCFYKYDYQARTWWRFSGISMEGLEIDDNYMSVLYCPSFSRKYMHMFVSSYWGKEINGKQAKWFMSFDNSMLIDDVYPYFVTKAFNTIPSEDSTLHNILLHVKGEEGTHADILVSYSLDDDSDEFRLIKEFTGFRLDGNSQTIPVYLPVSFVSRQHLYRLKVQIKANNPVLLYNIERRYRVHSRSR